DKIISIPVSGQGVEELIGRIKTYRYPLNPDLPQGYNHLDIDFDGNVITRGDRVVAIVDFEDLAYSPMIVCLGYTLWNILDDEGEGAMRYYLAEYEKVRPLTEVERKALPHVIFFRNYVLAVVRLMLWDAQTPISDITDLLELEKMIP